MATYYWVGGAGTWNSSSTTNWASSSGGAGGAGVPTSADDVIFDSASNATSYTVTLGTGAVCQSVTVNGPASGTVTIAQAAAWTIYGSLTFASTGVATSGSLNNMTFASTAAGNTITTNGVNLSCANFTISGSGSFSFGSAITLAAQNSNFVQTAGTLTTNNYNMSSFGGLSVSGGTINLGSSTVTAAAFYGGFSFAAPGTATVNAGTSTLTTLGSGGVNANGQTLYDINFNSGNSGTISSALTATSIRFNGAVSPSLAFAANVTITGTISTYNDTNPAARTFLRSNTTTARTITAAATALANVDFYYITAAGAASPFTGTNFSDRGGGNTNITFTAPKTVYWNLAGSQSFTATGWATTSGGTPAVANYPLIQDTAVIDNASSGTQINIAQSAVVCAIDASSRTSAFTIYVNQNAQFFGDILYGSGVTALTAITATITPYQGKSISVKCPSGFGIYNFSGMGVSGQKVTLLGDLITGFSVSFTNIGLDTGNYNITASALSFTSGTLDVNLGTSTISLTGTGTVFTMTSANLSAASSTIELANTTNSTSQTFSGGGKTYGTLSLNGGAATGQTKLITGSNTFSNITSNNTAAWQLRFSGGATNNFSNWNISGSPGNLVTINPNPLSIATTLNYTGSTYVSFNYASVFRTNGRPANFKWFAGPNSTDAGNNTGIFFTAPVTANSNNMFLLF